MNANSGENLGGHGPESGAPQRLHPLSLIVRAARTVPQVLVPLIFAGISIGWHDLFAKFPGSALFAPPVLFIAAIGIGLPVLLEYLGWRRFTWRLREEEILIEKGVLSRQRRSIPYERIQDVSLSQPLLHRVFGLAAVKLETGAGEGEDGSLNALLFEDAEALRVTVQRIKQEGQTGTATQPAVHLAGGAHVAGEEGRTIFAMDAQRLLIAGVFGFSLVAFAVLGAVTQNVQMFLPDIFSWERIVAELLGLPSNFGQISWMMEVAGVVMGAATLVAIGIVTGIVRSFVRDYDFRLDRTERGFRRRRGLFTLTDMAMPLHRVQAALIQTGPLRRIFGWFSLKLVSLASETDKEADHLVAPLANRAEIAAIMNETAIRPRFDGDGLCAVERNYVWVEPVFLLPLPLAGLCVAALLVDLRLLLIVPAVILAVTGLQYLEWRMHGYRLDEGHLFVRHGVFNQTVTALPLDNVQSADVNIGPFGRLLGVADVVVAIAGGKAVKIHHVRHDLAFRLRDRLA